MSRYSSYDVHFMSQNNQWMPLYDVFICLLWYRIVLFTRISKQVLNGMRYLSIFCTKFSLTYLYLLIIHQENVKIKETEGMYKCTCITNVTVTNMRWFRCHQYWHHQLTASSNQFPIRWFWFTAFSLDSEFQPFI